MKYKYILCDADDTLLDFAAAERQAFKESCATFGVTDTDETYEKYHKINDSHWKKFERGLTTKDRLIVERFEELFRETGLLPISAAREFSCNFLENISHQRQLLPDVPETLEKLSRYYKIFIITNGTAVAQHGRLDGSPVMEYVNGHYISEEIGAAKPSADFFSFVINDIGDTDLSSYLIVGDSPTSDIKGAINFGIDSCYVTNGKEYKDYGQTYAISTISEILNIL